MVFTLNELKERALKRTAQVLYSFWEEQKDNNPRTVAVHSRLFETLISNSYIELNTKVKGRDYPEHVVPCAYIRNHVFKMFWEGKSVDDATIMITRLLRIAYITKSESEQLDAVHKYTMPDDWNPDSDSILRRLEDEKIELLK